MIKKLFETIYGRDYELRERIFRMLILVGTASPAWALLNVFF